MIKNQNSISGSSQSAAKLFRVALVVLFVPFFGRLPSTLAAEPESGLLIYMDPPIGSMKAAESIPFSKFQRKSVAYSDVLLLNGKTQEIANAGILALFQLPGANTATQPAVEQKAAEIVRKYPAVRPAVDAFLVRFHQAQAEAQKAKAIDRTASGSQVSGAKLSIGGTTYTGVTLESVDGEFAKIMHSDGVANLPLATLTKEQIALLNSTSSAAHIDPEWSEKKKIADAEKEQRAKLGKAIPKSDDQPSSTPPQIPAASISSMPITALPADKIRYHTLAEFLAATQTGEIPSLLRSLKGTVELGYSVNAILKNQYHISTNSSNENWYFTQNVGDMFSEVTQLEMADTSIKQQDAARKLQEERSRLVKYCQDYPKVVQDPNLMGALDALLKEYSNTLHEMVRVNREAQQKKAAEMTAKLAADAKAKRQEEAIRKAKQATPALPNAEAPTKQEEAANTEEFRKQWFRAALVACATRRPDLTNDEREVFTLKGAPSYPISIVTSRDTWAVLAPLPGEDDKNQRNAWKKGMALIVDEGTGIAMQRILNIMEKTNSAVTLDGWRFSVIDLDGMSTFAFAPAAFSNSGHSASPPPEREEIPDSAKGRGLNESDYKRAELVKLHSPAYRQYMIEKTTREMRSKPALSLVPDAEIAKIVDDAIRTTEQRMMIMTDEAIRREGGATGDWRP